MDCRSYLAWGPATMTGFIVVNVDDLGLHSAVNRFVARAAAEEAISSASLLANGPRVGEALELIRQGRLGSIGIGVHLNVLRGSPLAPPSEVRSLLGPDDRFLGKAAAFAARLLTGRIVLEEVEREWRHQIEFLRTHGVEPDHGDGEKHTHVLPGLYRMAERLCEEYAIPWLRRPCESTFGGIRAGTLKPAVLNAFAALSPPRGRTRHADEVWGISHAGEKLSASALARFLGRCPGSSVVEIICHPGLIGEEDETISGMGSISVAERWQEEANALLSRRWLDVILDSRRELSSFSKI